MKTVKMKNPQTGGVATVSETAFSKVWKHKGWERVDADTADRLEDAATTAAPFDVAGAKKDELIARARALGLDTDGTADELRSRITAHEEG